MRIDVKKYLFVGHQSALAAFFEQAQRAGCVQFIDPQRLNTKEIPKEIQEVVSAIKILRQFPVVGQLEPEDKATTEEIVRTVNLLKAKMEALHTEQRSLHAELARIAPFGQFSLEDLQFIEARSGLKMRFFLAKGGLQATQELPDACIQIDKQQGLEFFIALTKESIHHPKLIEMHFDRSYEMLQQRIQELDHDQLEYELSLKGYAKYEQFLHQVLAKKYDQHHLAAAQRTSASREDGTLFSVEGWVPVDKIELLEQSLQGEAVQFFEIALEKEEVAPTYLENRGLSQVGEDLVHIYDTPSNTDRDPSLWVLFAFALFFGMIVNDAGYGLVFLMASLYFRFKKPEMRKAEGRMWKLSILLFSCCIVWGVMTNSFFGMTLEPDHGFRKFSVLNKLVEMKAEYHFSKRDAVYDFWIKEIPALAHATSSHDFLREAKTGEIGSIDYSMMSAFSDSILMELSLLVGMIHISLGFLRYIRRNWGGIGWVLAIWGGYFYFPLTLKATTFCHYVFGFDRDLLGAFGLQLIYIGVGTALLASIIRNKWAGIFELMNAIQVFADVLSYLRLYALGLAGAIVASTLNEIAGSLLFMGGGVLLLLGHGINMVLAIVGGVIHGLRLNFIEWYHYSFEGGGKAFLPLHKKESTS